MIERLSGPDPVFAWRTTTARSFVIGQVLRDRYVLESRLGTDAGGTVFKALDRLRSTLPDSYRYVALKVLHAGPGCAEETLATLRLGFHSAQLLSHRNIVNVYELDRDGDVVFFTMEFLDGEPLSHLLKRLAPGAMLRSQAWGLIQQLGAGLASAHEREVVHGNLKPENIFITREGELRILNFGAEQGLLAGQARPGSGGAPKLSAYASCEQLEGRRPDPRDDLYALACISYELLAGTHPFGLRPATLARDYRVSLTRPHGLGGRQWRALQQGLSWHRGGRSIGTRAWMRRLNNGEREHSVTPLQDLTVPNEVRSKPPWHAAAAALLLVVILTTAVVLAQLKSAAASKATAASSPPPAATPVMLDARPPTDFVITRTSDAPAKAAALGAPQPKAVMKAVSPAISIDSSQVRSDDHFAEIRLHRDRLQKADSFTWWTEPATAKAGVDYVPEAVAIQTFPAGFHTTRLYVRLIPQSLRSRRSYFYIAIAQPGPHHTAASVIRRQVWLPESSSLQARR